MTDSTEIIETMAAGLYGIQARSDVRDYPRLPKIQRDGYELRARAMLRAAKAEGWELCRLPDGRNRATFRYDDGWNDCLDEIERLELEAES